MKMDRKLVAATQPYEVRYFARKWGLTASEARAIIKEYGPSRKACNEVAYARGLTVTYMLYDPLKDLGKS